VVQEESAKPPSTAQDSRLVKMLNIQGKEEVESRVGKGYLNFIHVESHLLWFVLPTNMI
jgi:hypothetical protein